jgi:chaperonin GroEL (HSP60 family)
MTTKDTKGKSPKKTETQKKSTKEQENLGDALAQALFGETEKKPKKRPYFYLEDFGLIIPYWGIISVEKTYEWGRINGKTQMVYGLIINQGIESSPNMPFGERKTVYANQEVRDSKFNAIVKAMEEHNYEFSRI